MSLEVLYRIHVEFEPTGQLVSELSLYELGDAIDDLTTALHGLAIGSDSCESSNGTPASSPNCRAEFSTRQEAEQVHQAWLYEILNRRFTTVE